MARIYISLGSNIDRDRNTRAGVSALRQRFGELELSSVYESEAVGFNGDAFYNMVIACEVDEDVHSINRALAEIEDAHGRDRSGPRFSSRTLDLDLLLYDDLVLDEHGGVDGIVTVKDLIAELVGEIQDEYDPREPSIFRLADRMWIVEGRVPVEELEEELGTGLPEGPYASVAGLYLTAAGRIPEVGDSLDVDGVTFTVLRMDRRRIDRMRVETSRSVGPT